MAIVTIYFKAKQRLGTVQREVLGQLKHGPMLSFDFSRRHDRALTSLFMNELITSWENQHGQYGYQITDKGRKALEG